MSDQIVPGADDVQLESSIPQPAPVDSPPPTALTLDSLDRSVRRLRIWLLVLSAVLAIVVIASVGILAYSFFGFALSYEDISGVDEQTVEGVDELLQSAYGADLVAAEVRVVRVDYGDIGFPWSLVSGAGGYDTIYLEYSLAGAESEIAGLVGLDGSSDVISAGMIPPHGSLTSRMGAADFVELLAAYGEQTSAPLGSLLRYGDTALRWGEQTATTEEVVVDGATYRTAELWSATEGTVVEGDTVDYNERFAAGATVLVFHQDPATGEFTYLGREQAPAW